MITNAQSISIKYNGGLNTQSGPLSIADNESPNCKNVHTNLVGALLRRNGHTEFSDSTVVRDGWGIFDYWKDANTHYLMVHISNKLYSMDIGTNNEFDGTLDELTLGYSMGAAPIEFEQFDEGGTNYLVMSTHNRDTLQKWNGSGATTIVSDDTNLPKPKYIKVWKGYLFCANIANYESRVYYNSTSGNITSATGWSATDYQDIRTTDGDFITGLALLKGRLYTFKRYSIHRWTYTGATPLFSIKEAVTGIGTISSKSIKNINHPKYGEVLVFLGADARFYAFDGSQAWPISVNIETDNDGVSEFNLSKLSRPNLYKACADNYKTRHWYTCWVATGNDNNWCVLWDYYIDTWWPFDGMDATSCGVAQHGGKQVLFFTKADGKVYRFDDGNDDDGSNITAIHDSKHFSGGNVPLLKSNHYMDLQLRNVNRNISLYKKSDWDVSFGTAETISCNGGGFVLGTSKLGDTLGGAEAVHKTADLPTIDHMQQYRIYSSDTSAPWALYGADIVLTSRGFGGV